MKAKAYPRFSKHEVRYTTRSSQSTAVTLDKKLYDLENEKYRIAIGGLRVNGRDNTGCL